jgi:hypothetical protein
LGGSVKDGCFRFIAKNRNHLLSKAYNNKHRHSLEKIYHILEIIDKSISGFADNDKTVTETLSFDELMQSFDYQAKQNNKDAKKERIRIPTRLPRDVARDGNHPLLGVILYVRVISMRLLIYSRWLFLTLEGKETNQINPTTLSGMN